MPDECIFCKIASGQAGVQLLHEDDQVVAFPDINPQAPTHVLVIPKKHIEKVSDLASDEQDLPGRLVTVANELAVKLRLDAGYRLVINCGDQGGQAVYHLHLHLLGGRQMSWPPG